MKKLLLVAAIGFTALLSSQAKAQVSLSVNIGSPQPQYVSEGYYYAQPEYRVIHYAPQRVVRRTVVYREAPRARVYRTRYISQPRYRVQRDFRDHGRGPGRGHGGRGRH